MQQTGYRVPEDISVVGFDDISCNHNFTPAVTSIKFSRHDLGKRAIQLLCRQLRDGPDSMRSVMGEDLTEVFPVELAVHDSTRPLGR